MPNIVKPSGINLLWAAGGTKVDPGQAKTNIGWVVELPPYQYQNWLDNRQDTFIAHINQHGIAEWDSETEYQGNLSYTQGTDGLIYKCIQTNTNRNPTNPVNNIYWAIAFEAYGAVATVQNALTAHIANYQTLTGLTNLTVARNNLGVYSKTEGDNRYARLLGNSANQFQVADATLPSHAVPLGQLNTLLEGATEAIPGGISIATVGEVEAGVNDTKAVTPAKSQAVYVKKSQNLADIPNKALARANLGLSDTATLPSSNFMKGANNLSEIVNAGTARNNLGLGSISTMSAGAFLQTANNLSDLASPATARGNLGLADMATTSSANVMFKSQNLAGLTNVAQARANLGLSDSVLYPSNTWLVRSNNLADLPNTQAARNNLGLSAVATMPLYTPTAVSSLDFSANFTSPGFQRLPGGFHMQWGVINMGGGSAQVNTFFPVAFPNVCVNIQLTNRENAPGEVNVGRVLTMDRNGFVFLNTQGNTFTEWMWFAIGW